MHCLCPRWSSSTGESAKERLDEVGAILGEHTKTTKHAISALCVDFG